MAHPHDPGHHGDPHSARPQHGDGHAMPANRPADGARIVGAGAQPAQQPRGDSGDFLHLNDALGARAGSASASRQEGSWLLDGDAPAAPLAPQPVEPALVHLDGAAQPDGPTITEESAQPWLFDVDDDARGAPQRAASHGKQALEDSPAAPPALEASYCEPPPRSSVVSRWAGRVAAAAVVVGAGVTIVQLGLVGGGGRSVEPQGGAIELQRTAQPQRARLVGGAGRGQAPGDDGAGAREVRNVGRPQFEGNAREPGELSVWTTPRPGEEEGDDSQERPAADGVLAQLDALLAPPAEQDTDTPDAEPAGEPLAAAEAPRFLWPFGVVPAGPVEAPPPPVAVTLEVDAVPDGADDGVALADDVVAAQPGDDAELTADAGEPLAVTEAVELQPWAAPPPAPEPVPEAGAPVVEEPPVAPEGVLAFEQRWPEFGPLPDAPETSLAPDLEDPNAWLADVQDEPPPAHVAAEQDSWYLGRDPETWFDERLASADPDAVSGLALVPLDEVQERDVAEFTAFDEDVAEEGPLAVAEPVADAQPEVEVTTPVADAEPASDEPEPSPAIAALLAREGVPEGEPAVEELFPDAGPELAEEQPESDVAAALEPEAPESSAADAPPVPDEDAVVLDVEPLLADDVAAEEPAPDELASEELAPDELTSDVADDVALAEEPLEAPGRDILQQYAEWMRTQDTVGALGTRESRGARPAGALPFVVARAENPTPVSDEPQVDPHAWDPGAEPQDVGERVGGLRRIVSETRWAGTEVPLHLLDSKLSVTTPNVGFVRVVRDDGEIFEGKLNHIGGGLLELEDANGRLALPTAGVARVEALDPDQVRSGKALKPDFRGLPHVRVVAPGGTFTGRELDRVGNRITLMTDDGFKLTLDALEIEQFGKRKTVRLKRRAPDAEGGAQ